MWQQTLRLPTYCQNGSNMSFVGQEPAQNGQAGCKALEEQKKSQDVGQKCVFVSEAPYPGSMLSKAGKNTATEQDQIKICQKYEQATVPNKACSQIKINW